jgi:hypothetical protein
MRGQNDESCGTLLAHRVPLDLLKQEARIKVLGDAGSANRGVKSEIVRHCPVFQDESDVLQAIVSTTVRLSADHRSERGEGS